jgi:cytochrome c peroxidase
MYSVKASVRAAAWALLSATSLYFWPAHAQVSAVPSLTLKNVPVPGPSAEVLSHFVQDKAAAIQLGKALFWDQRVGSDNKTACATCHFAGGADTRLKNQISPGPLRLAPEPDKTFQLGAAPNYTLSASDFPLLSIQISTTLSRVCQTSTMSLPPQVYSRPLLTGR